MSFPTKIEQDQKARSAEYGRAREEGLSAIFAAFPTVPRHQANELMVEEICAHFLGLQLHQCAPTLSVFKSAIEADPSLLGGSTGVAIEHIEKQKANLRDEILELIASKDGGRDGKFNSENLRNEEVRMKYWSLEALHKRLNEVKFKQATSDVQTLKSFVRDSRPPARKYPGYPDLPQTIVPNGSVQAIRCDAAYLLGLAKTDFYEYKRMCNRFSRDQITARQQGRD
jgi:hypothetical protein